MKSRPKSLVILALLVLMAVGFAFGSSNQEKSTIAQFYTLREKTLDQRGTKEDVDRLLQLFAPDAKYEHPSAGVVMTIEEARSGMLAHLNEGTNANFHLNNAKIDRDFAVVEVTLNYTVQGKAISRRGVTLFDFKNGKIARVAEY